MALIFMLSAQADLDSGLGWFDTVLRKLAHMAQFGLLWWLWWRALGWGSPWPAVAITLAYAATDELHQSLVAGRVGSPIDWAIDAAGVGLAGFIAARRRGRTPRTGRSSARSGPEPRTAREGSGPSASGS